MSEDYAIVIITTFLIIIIGCANVIRFRQGRLIDKLRYLLEIQDRTIKSLNETIAAQEGEIAALKGNLEIARSFIKGHCEFRFVMKDGSPKNSDDVIN